MPGPLDAVLDAIVYVPVGLAVSAKESFPELAARGRERVASARTVGQFAVQQGQAHALRLLERVQAAQPGATPDAGNQAAAPAAPHAPTGAPAVTTSGPEAGSLAVPGYDSLSASQVLPRLDGLDVAELEAVRAYEAAHRGRKTILARIAQLQAS